MTTDIRGAECDPDTSPCLLQVSLTLEEKQRLAKEQEQAAKLRSQQPLAPQAIKPATSSSSKVRPESLSQTKNTDLPERLGI